MNQTRLNVRIEGVMADHVDGLIEKKLYNSQSEYVRDLIRHDMSRKDEMYGLMFADAVEEFESGQAEIHDNVNERLDAIDKEVFNS